MRHAVGALAVLAALGASPAFADGPDPAYRPQAPGYRPAYRSAGYRRAAFGYRRPGSDIGSYGPPPAFRPEAYGRQAYGQLAYRIVTGPVEYTEAYIGRGIVYNTPPAPAWPTYSVISARY